MTIERRASFALLPALALMFFGGHGTLAGEVQPKQVTRGTMRQIFGALATAYPLSLDEEQFQDPENRKRLLFALGNLSRNAGNLRNHGQELGQSFTYLRGSLSSDAREAAESYEKGEYERSRFLLHELTDNCFACHSRLPSDRKFDLGKEFLKNASIHDLDPEERVRLEVATRQFDTAVATYETIFRSGSITAGEIGLMGAFEDYLKLSIRVRGDYKRTIKALEKFRKREDVPPYLADQLAYWVTALKELQAGEVKGNKLSRARSLIGEARRKNRFPEDRRGLVQFIAASSLLHQYVDSGRAKKTGLPEAYYLLGVTEAYISHSAWISETEYFLETAIRQNPRSPFARKSFSFLEDYTLMTYSGTSGLNLPEDVREHLEELRTLVGKPPDKSVPPGS